MPKYVALEGLKEGNKFYTGYTEGTDHTRLASGELAYRVLGYADTDKEALKLLGYGIDPEYDRRTMTSYLFKTGKGLFSEEACDRLSYLLKE